MDKIKDAQGLVDQLLDETKEVKVSDVPKDKQDIFKINRAKAGIKGGKLTKAEKSGDRIKESDESLDECSCDAGKPMDQEKVALQKDTLFDSPERMVKDKTDDEASLNPVPNTEAISVAKVLDARKKQKSNFRPNKNRDRAHHANKVARKLKNPSNRNKLNNYFKGVKSRFSASVKGMTEEVAPNGHGEEKRNTVVKNQRDRLSELFGFGKSVSKKRKEVQSGKYKGKSKTLTDISKKQKMLNQIMNG